MLSSLEKFTLPNRFCRDLVRKELKHHVSYVWALFICLPRFYKGEARVSALHALQCLGHRGVGCARRAEGSEESVHELRRALGEGRQVAGVFAGRLHYGEFHVIKRTAELRTCADLMVQEVGVGTLTGRR